MTAEPIIRTGVIREALPEVSRELGASFIVLGRPAGESSQFQESEFEKFSEWLQNETDATIVVYEEPVES
jgi:RNase H-fold protein (predicted Holliday junction resolvase)